MSSAHRLEDLAFASLAAGLRALPRGAAMSAGAALGNAVRLLGVRRAVARDNLARAFPERGAAWVDATLARHYRELGRIVAEYPRLAALVHAPPGEVVAEVRGSEHLDRVRAEGRGAILMSGHYGNFELLAAFLGRFYPLDFVVRPMSNPYVEARIVRERNAAGMNLIDAGTGVRRVYEALRAGRWVGMLGDQDARRQGVFVPFLGRPASTAAGPARIALARGVPIIMGFIDRGADGRYVIEMDAPLVLPDPRAPDAIGQLTAMHVRRLEEKVRARPECWFWLHRRWKTQPPAATVD